jgi:hypothetical protein
VKHRAFCRRALADQRHPLDASGGRIGRSLREEAMNKYKLVCTLALGDILIQFLLWLILIAITVGFAIPFFGYYFIRLIINHTEIHQIS